MASIATMTAQDGAPVPQSAATRLLEKQQQLFNLQETLAAEKRTAATKVVFPVAIIYNEMSTYAKVEALRRRTFGHEKRSS